MCKILHRYDILQCSFIKTNFPSHFNYGNRWWNGLLVASLQFNREVTVHGHVAQKEGFLSVTPSGQNQIANIFVDDILTAFHCLKNHVLNKLWLKIVADVQADHKATLVQIIAWGHQCHQETNHYLIIYLMSTHILHDLWRHQGSLLLTWFNDVLVTASRTTFEF